MSRNNINKVFYATSYHPIQAGSIDGTDVLTHDNAVYRALLCSSAGLYDPFGDPKVIGDSYRTLFVGHLSHFTSEESLRKAMKKYGRVKNLRLVRHIVTGASRGYAFVEFETDQEMLRAYEEAHHSIIDDSEIIVDYNRQRLMPGWIPRRLGGGLGGKKESGQLRFGGRERPFRAPLRPIPFNDLKRLGVPLPPEGRYLQRFEVPSPPRRGSTGVEDAHPRERNREREISPPAREINQAILERETLVLISRKKPSLEREETSRRARRDEREESSDRRDSEYLHDHRRDRHRRHSRDFSSRDRRRD